jgi:toxin-antitoxin system PIN domain toxin
MTGRHCASSSTSGGTAVLCPDVNVLVDAFRPDATRHELARTWLVRAQDSPETIGILPDAAAAFIRIVTNRRIWAHPSPIDEAMAVLSDFLSSPRVTMASPPNRRWNLFVDLCVQQGLTGDEVTDVYLAAGALSLNATFVTSDRGFRRFHDLKLEVLED